MSQRHDCHQTASTVLSSLQINVHGLRQARHDAPAAFRGHRLYHALKKKKNCFGRAGMRVEICLLCLNALPPGSTAPPQHHGHRHGYISQTLGGGGSATIKNIKARDRQNRAAAQHVSSKTSPHAEHPSHSGAPSQHTPLQRSSEQVNTFTCGAVVGVVVGVGVAVAPVRVMHACPAMLPAFSALAP